MRGATPTPYTLPAGRTLEYRLAEELGRHWSLYIATIVSSVLLAVPS